MSHCPAHLGLYSLLISVKPRTFWNLFVYVLHLRGENSSICSRRSSWGQSLNGKYKAFKSEHGNIILKCTNMWMPTCVDFRCTTFIWDLSVAALLILVIWWQLWSSVATILSLKTWILKKLMLLERNCPQNKVAWPICLPVHVIFTTIQCKILILVFVCVFINYQCSNDKNKPYWNPTYDSENGWNKLDDVLIWYWLKAYTFLYSRVFS